MNVDIHHTNRGTLPNGFPAIAIEIPDLSIRNVLDLDFDPFQDAFGEPDPISLDLLLIAGIVYVLDKAVQRRSARDCWTREFSVRFPVSDPHHWLEAKKCLEGGLSFLTGDEWTISFRKRPEMTLATAERRNPDRALPADAVSLFSGGLDSLIGTINWLARNEGGKMMLIGHHDATMSAADQKRLWNLLDSLEYKGRTDFRGVRVRPLPEAYGRPGRRVVPSVEGPEQTLRSRSFLFLALGLYAAHALGPRVPLLMPENGFIAINIPLTPSRIGTCSTRTMHPYFLDTMREMINILEFENAIENPLEDQTKGETLKNCLDRATLKKLAPQSVSCAHSSRRGDWRRTAARNCGYCVPCLIRRAALHYVGRDHGMEYGLDVCAGEIDLEALIASDVRAVLDCLHSVHKKSEIEERVLMTGPLRDRFNSSVELVVRGLDELRTFLREKGSAKLRRLAGIR